MAQFSADRHQGYTNIAGCSNILEPGDPESARRDFAWTEEIESIVKKILLIIIPLLLIAGCTQKALYNVEDAPISSDSSGKQPTLASVEKAIVKACRHKGWIPRKIADGVIEASIFVRSHKAVVEITFDENAYSINYKNSDNLDYRKRSNNRETIHRNYNRWIANLNGVIQSEISLTALGY